MCVCVSVVRWSLTGDQWTIVHAFWPESEIVNFGQKGYHMKGHLKRSRMVQISAS